MARPELPHIRYYEYQPQPVAGFQDLINPFLALNGYKFLSFQLSIASRGTAVRHQEYEKALKPPGIKPDDKLYFPDIVYMVAEKK